MLKLATAWMGVCAQVAGLSALSDRARAARRAWRRGRARVAVVGDFGVIKVFQKTINQD
jgi:hypothetical protein